jgi:type II secretion system protein N
MIEALKRKNRYWYIIYIAVLLAVFLYVMFPDSVLKDIVSAQAEKRFPDLDIRFEKTGFRLPLGIIFKGLEVALKDNPDEPLYVSEKTSVKVSITGLLFGNMKVTFSSRVNGGEISGVFEEKGKEGCNITAVIDAIILDGKPFIHPELSRKIEGTLSGKINYTGESAEYIRGNGNISLEMVNGRFKLLIPLFDVDGIGFKMVSLTGALDNMNLNVKDLSMTGGPFNGRVKGDVQLKEDILSSGLRLSAKITTAPEMKKEMPELYRAIEASKIMKNGSVLLDIQGTLTKPLPVIR